MKRSGSTRFTVEAAFLIVVAAGAALAGFAPLRIIVLMLVAWLLVGMIERASVGDQLRTVAGPAPDQAVMHEARAGFFGRLWRKPVEPLASPTDPLEERPSNAHVRRREPEPETPVAEIDGEPDEPKAMVEEAPTPAVTKRPLELPGLEVPEREPEPEPVAAPPPAIEAPPPPPAPPPAPREWNIWDLERRAREQARDAARDEEWTALFVHLRQFATPAGVLPVEFDGLVRESFADLIRAA